MLLACSYLLYGLLAARAEILKIDQEHGSPCLLTGYNGVYKFALTWMLHYFLNLTFFYFEFSLFSPEIEFSWQVMYWNVALK